MNKLRRMVLKHKATAYIIVGLAIVMDIAFFVLIINMFVNTLKLLYH